MISKIFPTLVGLALLIHGYALAVDWSTHKRGVSLKASYEPSQFMRDYALIVLLMVIAGMSLVRWNVCT